MQCEDFVRQLDGATLARAVGRTFAPEDVPPMASGTGEVRCSRPIFVDRFAFLKSATRKTAKLTIPAPATLHFRGGRNATAPVAARLRSRELPTATTVRRRGSGLG